MATSSEQQHWLVGVASRAGLGDLHHMRMRLDTPPVEAWELAATELNISKEELAGHVAKAFGIEVADLESATAEAAGVVPAQEAQKLLVLPLRVTDRTLVLATADPLDTNAENEIAFLSGRNVEFEIAPPAPLRHAINHAYRTGVSGDFVVTNEALQEAAEQVEFVGEPEQAHEQDLGGKAWAMVGLTSLVLLESVKAEAEVVMIGPMEAGGRVRFQIDGELRTFLRVTRQTLPRITDRIKVLAGIDDVDGAAATDTQTGEIVAHIQGMDYIVRVSSTPDGDVDEVVLWLTEASRSVAASEGETGSRMVPTPVALADVKSPAAPLALIVDDEPTDLLVMRVIMESLEFSVVEAVDGEDAMRHLDGNKDFAVMLLDLKMPGIDGLDVLKHVRQTLKTAALPVVVLTASEDPGDQNRLLTAGANDYIKKPIDPPWAAKRVQAVLRRAVS